MPGGKAKVPEYPRPVSPVSAEEYPICHNTIVYDEGDEDPDDSPEKRAAKRRRIESYAAAYLRGQPLFILSAQLKGPFDKGWKNPWRRKTKGEKNTETGRLQLEVPETTIKPQPQIAGTSPHANKVSHDILTPIYPTKQISKQHLPGKTTSTSNSVLPVKQTSSTAAAYIGTPESKIRQVEDWLRKNENSSQPGESLPQSSPSLLTRPTKKRSKKWESPVLEIEFPPVPDDIVGHVPLPPLQRPLAPGVDHPPAAEEHLEVPAHPDISTTPDSPHRLNDESMKDTQSDEPPDVLATATHRPILASNSGSRAEDAILALKRRSLHTIPPSSHLPAFEYRRATTKETIQGAGFTGAQEPSGEQTTQVKVPSNVDIQTASKSSEQAESLHTAIEGNSPGLIEHATAPSVKANSGPSTNRDIPSAQIPIQVTLESAPSNLSGPGALLEEPRRDIDCRPDQGTVDQVNGDVPDVPENNAPSQALGIPAPGLYNGIAPRDQFEQPVAMQSETTPKPASVWPSDTQQMIESITPIVFSTIKKPKKTTGIQNNTTPRTATKVRRTSKGKRTSFAPEGASSSSSMGSLKAIMKVAKSPKMDRDHLNCLKTTWEDEDDDENSVHSIHHVSEAIPNVPLTERATKNGTGTPRGILKSSSNPSALGLISGIHKTASSSFKQDAQRVRALGMIEDDIEIPQDDFDVDAVMDDLGSYLGTWDPEKEALALGKASE
ncbi:hypothetical protein LTR84_009636 [Exophiala bonariae]|uniref:Protamine P1 n=1 Tax=Exophiala bonariae TaxID=1690606 RepID=A0AAV9NML3_9EURO|nr:hypothetical protein LTR84_009636 [Exophiala bonariae]